jgi:uncharacterized repeat protein (TIGR01451 family)
MRQRSGVIRRSFAAFALAGLAATLGTGVAFAQTPTPTPSVGAPPAKLTLTTTYPSISVDPDNTAKFPLQVLSPNVERVDLTVTGTPDGWESTLKGGGLIVGSVTTTGTSVSPALELDVKVPAGVQPGTTKLQVHGVAPSGQADLTVDLVVGDISGGSATLTSDVVGQRGDTSKTFTFNLRLANDTATEQTFTFEGTGPDGWTVTVQPSGQTQAASVVVGAGDTENLTATVKPAIDATAQQYPIDVTAAAGDVTAQTQLIVEITGSYSFTMTSPDGRLNTSATAGSTTTYQVVLTNTGSADLQNVALTATPPSGWTTTWDTPTITTIPVGQSANANLSITPPSGTIAGDYIVTLRANADQVSTPQTIQLRTTVDTSSIWGFVGIAIIALVLIGLFLVFQRYGRR